MQMGPDLHSIALSSTADVLRQRLAAHAPTFLMAVRSCPVPEMVHFAAATGHHGLYVDMQHGAMGVDAAAQLCLVARAMGFPALVRVPEVDAPLIGNVLDHGATGILVPDVEEAAMAERAVQAARHAPAGRRSAGGRRGFTVEPSPYVAVMIESARGVEAAATIAHCEGVDALVIGLVDLCAAIGDTPSGSATLQAVDQILAAGKAAGRPVIIAGLRDAQACRQMVQRGAARCFMTGTDISYLFEGAERQIAAFCTVFDPSADAASAS